MRTVIGIDFDNTLVALDSLFRQEAQTLGVITAAETEVTRAQIRDRLHAASRNDAWMDMQATVYGSRLAEATPFDGAIDAISQLRARGQRVVIVSHKTRFPLSGASIDLHEAARAWLRARAFCGGDGALISEGDVFFEPTPEAKIARIAALGCTAFVDDLPSILGHSSFPDGTQRILFDPNGEHESAAGHARARSWRDVETSLASVLAAPVLARAGFGGGALTPIVGGANNRVYRVDAGPAHAVLKAYYAGAHDRRDRLGTEWAFLQHLASTEVDGVPRPLARDDDARFGVYSFIEGEPVSDAERMDAARAFELVDFVARSNRASAHGAELPLASEACLSIAAHLDAIDRRLARTASIPAASPAASIAHEALPRIASIVRAEAVRRAESLAIDLDSTLDRDACILSASDFGFHNALRTPSGKLAFVDFEYAGWDDPAKLLCDLFTRPDGGIPFAHFDAVCTHLGTAFPELRGSFEARTRVLLPVHAVKWAALALNDYLPGDASRRAFALGTERALADRRLRQLDVAKGRLHFAMTLLPRAPLSSNERPDVK